MNDKKKQASRRKYHYIYKTTCRVTNKYYIGMHSTDNLKDGYLGSGKRLWYSIDKHGKNNHVKEILEFLPDRKSLKDREKEIVNSELLNEKLCMNIAPGGGGGFISKEHENNFQKGADKFRELSTTNAREKLKWLIKNDADWYDEWKKNMSTSLKGNQAFKGKNHSEESKIKIGQTNSAKQKGELNSQYGKRWITNDISDKKINRDDPIPEGWKLGRKLKK